MPLGERLHKGNGYILKSNYIKLNKLTCLNKEINIKTSL